MRIEAERKLFVGLRVDNKLREQLQTAAPKDKVFFDGSDERYLIVMRNDAADEDAFIGKIVDAGIPAASMDDLKRNLLSILNRIAPGRHREDAVKVFGVIDREGPTGAEALRRPGRDRDEDEGGGGAGGGGYERRY